MSQWAAMSERLIFGPQDFAQAPSCKENEGQKCMGYSRTSISVKCNLFDGVGHGLERCTYGIWNMEIPGRRLGFKGWRIGALHPRDMVRAMRLCAGVHRTRYIIGALLLH